MWLLGLAAARCAAEEPRLVPFRANLGTNQAPFAAAATTTGSVAFQAFAGRDWSPGLVPIFAVEKHGRWELRRRPGKGQENFSEPLFLALPPDTVIVVGHDYPPAGREPRWTTTVAEQRALNIHVRDGIDEQTFVERREARDATLGLPALFLPSLQVNVRGGELPPVEDNGVAYLRIPLNALPSRPRAGAGRP